MRCKLIHQILIKVIHHIDMSLATEKKHYMSTRYPTAIHDDVVS